MAAGWSFTASYFVFGALVFFNFTAVSLMILCCSRWVRSMNVTADDGGGQGDQENKPPEQQLTINVDEEACPEQIVVIMAGEQTPSFIATPAPSPPPTSLHDHIHGERAQIISDSV